MKRIFIQTLFAFSLLLCNLLHAQTSGSSTVRSWLWAKHPDGAIAGYTNPAVSNDANGNTYVTGAFIGTLTFQTSPSPTSLVSAGEADIFIAKYDASGNVVWAKRAGGAHGDAATAIRYDNFGNIYVVGNYSTATDFDGTILSNPVTVANNVFIAKYNATTGNLLWVKQGTASSDYSDQSAFDVAVDKQGNAYVTGYFGYIKFDPLPTLTTVGWWDMYVVKYSSAGDPLWQTTAGSIEPGYYSEAGNGIAVDALGNVFVTGKINGSSTYPTYFGNIALASNGGGGFYECNFFLAKYNQATSSWEWAVNGGGTTNDYGNKVSLDDQGNAYVGGYFEGTGTFGSATLTSTGSHDYFIAKYTSTGSQSWIHSIEGAGYFTSNASKVDANGNTYFAGTFDGSVTIGDKTLTSTGFDNTYVSSWNSNGEFQWVKHIPGDYYSQVNGLDVDNNGNVSIATVFASTETFDCAVLRSGTNTDLVVAKLGTTANGPDAPTVQATATSICSGNSTTLSITSGSLNNATEWKWYSGSCGSTLVGSGTSITVSPTQNTTYFVRGEGGCAGPGTCASVAININNSPPVITSLTAPIAPVAVNTPINLNLTYTGANVTTASVKWSDATEAETIANPTTGIAIPHTYSAPGVYTINVSLTNSCNEVASSSYQYVVVYDPNGGFATGGGWINSPQGAYRADVNLVGKAVFGFESKYLKGATVPSGNTEFKFQAGGMSFKSTNYEWLVVSGSKAQMKGTGTINGGGNYGFLLTGVDGNLKTPATADLFRIKIWDRSNDAIVYDNQYGAGDGDALTTQIAGGSIIIHNASTTTNIIGATQEAVAEYSGKLKVSVLPNPSAQSFTLITQSGSNKPVHLLVTDALGRAIENKGSVPANGTIIVGRTYRSGTYYATLLQGKERVTAKLVKIAE